MDTNKEELLDMVDLKGNTPLMEGILEEPRGAKTSILKEMVKKDADYSMQNKDGDNTLHLCVRMG